MFTEHSGLRHRFRERGRPVADGHEDPGVVVTHHEALEPPLIAEDLRQQAPLRACGHSVDRIICRRKRTLRLPVSRLTGRLRVSSTNPQAGRSRNTPRTIVAGLQEHIAWEALASEMQPLNAGKYDSHRLRRSTDALNV